MSLEYAEYIEYNLPNLQNLPYTLLSRRSTFKNSKVFTASTAREVPEKLRCDTSIVLAKSSEGMKNIIFLFTGQGAQWPQMGKSLMHQSPLFEAVMAECEGYLSTLPDGPSWSIRDELKKAKEVSNVYEVELSRPLCTALQLGIVVLLKS